MPSDPTPRSSFHAPQRNVPGLTTSFNPKAVQNAAQNPSPKKELPTGPFIDAVPAGRYNVNPGMSIETHLKRQAHIHFARRTVKALKVARWLQIFSRFCQLFAAIGLIVFLISLRGMDDIYAWIMRAPPCAAVLHTIYSIYHNCRSPRDRAPMSSALYALFAISSDCCLIPFYCFIALWTWNERQEMMANPLDSTNWYTNFDKTNIELNELVVFITFCLGVGGGGLMVISVLLGLYIAVTFRRISKLPPDMNPLDDSTFTSLTTRPSSKRFSKTSMTSFDSTDTKASFSKPGSRDQSPTRQVPFLEVRTKNGALNWEFSKENDGMASHSTLNLPDDIPRLSNTTPLLPPPHRMDGTGYDSRRNSIDVNNPGSQNTHRKTQSMQYYPQQPQQMHQSVNGSPPKPPRQTYRQRPADWWTAAPMFNAQPGSDRNGHYATLSQTDMDAESSHSTNTFGAPSPRGNMGRAPEYGPGVLGTPPKISSYAGSISNATISDSSPNHMTSPPGITTLGGFAGELAPRPLSFPNNQTRHTHSNSFGSHHNGSPSAAQNRNSIPRMPYTRASTMTSQQSSLGSPATATLGTFVRAPPATALTPPAQSPTKPSVIGGRQVEREYGPGITVYQQTPPSSPEKPSFIGGAGERRTVHNPPPMDLPMLSQPTTPGSSANSVREKKKRYENLVTESPGRSTSGDFREGKDGKKKKVKREDKERRKSLRDILRRGDKSGDEGGYKSGKESGYKSGGERKMKREKSKERGTRVVSNSSVQFGAMEAGLRGRVVSGSQVV